MYTYTYKLHIYNVYEHRNVNNGYDINYDAAVYMILKQSICIYKCSRGKILVRNHTACMIKTAKDAQLNWNGR